MPTRTYVFTEDECNRWRAVPDANPKTRYPITSDARYGVHKQLARQCASLTPKPVVSQVEVVRPDPRPPRAPKPAVSSYRRTRKAKETVDINTNTRVQNSNTSETPETNVSPAVPYSYTPSPEIMSPDLWTKPRNTTRPQVPFNTKGPQVPQLPQVPFNTKGPQVPQLPQVPRNTTRPQAPRNTKPQAPTSNTPVQTRPPPNTSTLQAAVEKAVATLYKRLAFDPAATVTIKVTIVPTQSGAWSQWLQMLQERIDRLTSAESKPRVFASVEDPSSVRIFTLTLELTSTGARVSGYFKRFMLGQVFQLPYVPTMQEAAQDAAEGTIDFLDLLQWVATKDSIEIGVDTQDARLKSDVLDGIAPKLAMAMRDYLAAIRSQAL